MKSYLSRAPITKSKPNNRSESVSRAHCPLVATERSWIKRALDIHGIDDNRGVLTSFNKSVFNIIAKRNASGEPNLESGAYISRSGVDAYGDFKWLNAKGLVKYQAPTVAVISFVRASELEQLSKTYSTTPFPDFLVNILNNEKCIDTELYLKNSDLARFIPPLDKEAHGFLIRPNSPYSSENTLNIYISSPKTLKNNKQGITLCTYAIHPSITSPFLKNQNKVDTAQRITISQQTQQSTLYKKSGIKPLTSILDLTAEHLPQLKKLKAKTLQHLRDVYDANENDSIRMFFHFPVAEKTATLHLHTWVNKGDHPLNEPRSFELDVLIKHLQDGKELSDLILSRNGGEFYLPTSDSIKDIPGIPFKGVINNPHPLPFNYDAGIQNTDKMNDASIFGPTLSRTLAINGIDFTQNFIDSLDLSKDRVLIKKAFDNATATR